MDHSAPGTADRLWGAETGRPGTVGTAIVMFTVIALVMTAVLVIFAPQVYRITGKISEFAKDAKIVHIDIDSASISKNIVVDIPIVADAKLAIEKLIKYGAPLKIEKWVDNRCSNERKISYKHG